MPLLLIYGVSGRRSSAIKVVGIFCTLRTITERLPGQSAPIEAAPEGVRRHPQPPRQILPAHGFALPPQRKLSRSVYCPTTATPAPIRRHGAGMRGRNASRPRAIRALSRDVAGVQKIAEPQPYAVSYRSSPDTAAPGPRG